MTKQDAEAFFARNPQGLRDMENLREAGLLDRLDAYYLVGRASITNEMDGWVNCIAAFKALEV